MASQDWQKAIVYWVNSLGLLDTNIIHVTELANGKFFHYLLLLLKNGVEDKASRAEITDQVYETLTTFLKNNYPDYCMDSDSSHIRDEVELTYVSSLLLFHSTVKSNVKCIDERMCLNLNQKTQVHITTFLESIQHEKFINKSILKSAIERADGVVENSLPKTPSPQGLFFTNSPDLPEGMCTPKRSRYPLKEFLQSPITTQRKLLDENTKELKKIKSQLQTEKFEKSDLQDELKITQEKLKNLYDKYTEKVQEMKKLREESLFKDELVPHSCEKNETSLYEKRLKDDVMNLEEYISKLENDLFSLQGDRDNLLLKLNQAENHSAIWQAKAEEFMPKCESLEQQIERKEKELTVLLERCRELEIHISEMRKVGDTSIEWDYSDLTASLIPENIPGENLGEAITDVKLQEMEEENIELKEQVTLLKVDSNEMSKTICDLQSRLGSTIENHDILMKDYVKLEEKVKMLTDIQTCLEETQLQLNATNLELFSLNEEKKSFQQQISDLQSLLVSKESVINELCSGTDSLKDEVDSWKVKYSQVNDFLETKIEQSEVIQRELKDSLKQAEEAKRYNCEMTQSLDTLNSHLETSVQKMKEIVYNEDNVAINSKIPAIELALEIMPVCKSVQLKVQELSKLLNELELKNVLTKEKLVNLEATCGYLNEKITQLCRQIQDLENKDKINLLENANLEECLHCANQSIVNLQNTIHEYERKIEELSDVVEEKKIVIQELENSRQVIANKDSKISKLEEEVINVERRLQEVIQELTDVKEERNLIQNLNTVLKENNEQEKNRMLDQVESLQLKISDSESDWNTVYAELQVSNHELSDIARDRHSILQQYNLLSQEKEECIVSFMNEISMLQGKIKELESTKEKSHTALQTIKGELEMLSNSKEELSNQYNNLCLESEIKCKFLKEKLTLVENEVEQLNVEKNCELQQAQDQILEIQRSKDSVTEKYTKFEQDTKEDMKQMSQELADLKSELQTQIKEKVMVSNELETTKASVLNLTNSREELLLTYNETMNNYESKIRELQSKVQNLEVSAGVLEKEKTDAVEQLHFVRLELLNVQESKENVVQHFNTLIQDKEEIVKDLIVKLDIMESDKSALKDELQSLTSKLTEMTMSKEEMCIEYKKQLLENEANSFTLTNKVATLQSHITQHEEDKNTLDCHLKSAETDLLVFKNSSEHLLEVNSKLKEDKDNVIWAKENELKKLVEEKESINSQLEITKLELSEIQKSHQSLIVSDMKQRDEKDILILQLSEKLVTVEHAMKCIEEEKTDITLELEKRQYELDAVKASKEDLEKVRKDQEESLASYLQTIHRNEDTIANLTKEMTELCNEVVTMKVERSVVDNELQSMKEKILDLESSNINCLQMCETVKEEGENRTSEIKSSLEEIIYELKNDKRNVAKELEVAQSELLDSRNNETALLNKYTKDKQTQENALEILLNKSSAFENEIKSLVQEKEALSHKLEIVQVELEEMHNKTVQEAEKCDSIQRQTEEENVLLKKKLKDAEWERNSEKARCADVEQLLTLERSNMQNMTKQQDELVAERDSIVSLCKTLAVNVQNLQERIASMREGQDSSKFKENEESSELCVLYDSDDNPRAINNDLNNFASETSLSCKSSVSSNGQRTDFESQETPSNANVPSIPSSSYVLEDAYKKSNHVLVLEKLNADLIFASGGLERISTFNDTVKEKLLKSDQKVKEIDEKYMSLMNHDENVVAENNKLKSTVEELNKGIALLEKNATKSRESIIEFDKLEAKNRVLNDTCEKLKCNVKNLEWQKKIESSKDSTTKVEVETLKQHNKELTEKLQHWEMMHLKYEEEYWKHIEAKQQTDITLENVLERRKQLEQKLSNTHSIIKCLDSRHNSVFFDSLATSKLHTQKIKVDMELLRIEEEYRKVSGEILLIIHSCFRWTEKSVESLCVLIGIDAHLKQSELFSKKPFTVPNATIPSDSDLQCNFIDLKNIVQVQIPSLECQIDSLLMDVESVLLKCQDLKAQCEATTKTHECGGTGDLKPVCNLKETFNGFNLEERAGLLKGLLTKGIHHKLKIEEPAQNFHPDDSVECDSLSGEPSDTMEVHTGLEIDELLKQFAELTEQNKSLSVLLKASEKAKGDLQKNVTNLKSLYKTVSVEKESAITQKTTLEEKVMKLETEFKSLDTNFRKLSASETKFKDANRKLKEDHNIFYSKYSEIKNKLVQRDLEWSQEKDRIQSQHKVELQKQLSDTKVQYEDKLQKLKLKMKLMYNEELAKVKHQYEGNSQQNKQYVDKISKFQQDISELNSQVWELSEKVLKEQKEKAELELRLKREFMKHKAARDVEDIKSNLESLGRQRKTDEHKNFQDRDAMDVIDESVTYHLRRRSVIKSVPSGIVADEAFPPEDEEDEVFGTSYLADLKAGRCQPLEKESIVRLSELQYRNSLCPPHLKSSYPAETQFHAPQEFNDDDLKGSESGTTPRSVLREQNDTSGSRKGSTPSRLRSLFSSKSNRRDENTPVTPRNKRLTFFRKPTAVKNHPW